MGTMAIIKRLLLLMVQLIRLLTERLCTTSSHSEEITPCSFGLAKSGHAASQFLLMPKDGLFAALLTDLRSEWFSTLRWVSIGHMQEKYIINAAIEAEE